MLILFIKNKVFSVFLNFTLLKKTTKISKTFVV